MRPKERHPTGQKDIYQSRLDQIIDLNHPLVKLAHKIDWTFLETKLGAVYTDKKGRPPLSTRISSRRVVTIGGAFLYRKTKR